MKNKKTIKIYEESDKVFTVVDKVSKTVGGVYMAKNELDIVRQLAFIGFWKTNRFIDTEIYETGYMIDGYGLSGICAIKKIDIVKCAEELSIQLENKAKSLGKDKAEIEKAIENNGVEISKEIGDNKENE